MRDSDHAGRDIIDKILLILDRMDSVDDSALLRRVMNTVREKHRKKRGMSLLQYAAIILPLALAAAALWYAAPRENTITRHSGVTRLIMPNGKEYVVDERFGTHAEPNIHKENGTLVFDKGDENASYYTVDVAKGGRFDLILEDGTHVWINADSRLSYPSRFADNERRVKLDGEAYFEVARDSAKPFVVDTHGMELKVLGTKFNISAYDDDGFIYTTLVEGKVSLMAESHGTLLLDPGEQASLDLNGGGFRHYSVSTEDATTWRYEVIAFDGHTLEQIMMKLSRIYNIEYRFEAESLKGLITRGTMPVQDDIKIILRLIEAAGNVSFNINGDRITIKQAE